MLFNQNLIFKNINKNKLKSEPQINLNNFFLLFFTIIWKTIIYYPKIFFHLISFSLHFDHTVWCKTSQHESISNWLSPYIKLVQPRNKLLWVNFRYHSGPTEMCLHLIGWDSLNKEMTYISPCMWCKVLNLISSLAWNNAY